MGNQFSDKWRIIRIVEGDEVPATHLSVSRDFEMECTFDEWGIFLSLTEKVMDRLRKQADYCEEE